MLMTTCSLIRNDIAGPHTVNHVSNAGLLNATGPINLGVRKLIKLVETKMSFWKVMSNQETVQWHGSSFLPVTARQ